MSGYTTKTKNKDSSDENFSFRVCISSRTFGQFLFELVWTTEFVITLWYWLGAATLRINHSGRLAIYAVIAHSLPFSLIVIDTIFNMIKFRLIHFICFQPIYITYGIVNWLYVKLQLGPGPIYPYRTGDNGNTYTVMEGGASHKGLKTILKRA